MSEEVHIHKKTKKKKRRCENIDGENESTPPEEIVPFCQKNKKHKRENIEEGHQSTPTEEIVPPCQKETTIEEEPKLTKFKEYKGEICKPTMKAIKDMNFTNMTDIQAKTLLPLINGQDLVGVAKTGSGKTLAFLIPLVEQLFRRRVTSEFGTCGIIISPTRELAIQIHEVLISLLKYHHNLTYGLVIGGIKRKEEKKLLCNGVNILVATPGRLLDHIENTENFKYDNLSCLILDEVDRILDYGFEEDLKQILRLLPKSRQTMMFSATQTERVRLLSTLALKEDPLYIGVDDDKETSTVSTLKQFYVLCPVGKRLLYLHYLLKKIRKKKVMVFFSTRGSVDFHYKFFTSFETSVNLMYIHGKNDQTHRTRTYFDFCNSKSAILFCTDVAARGLDIPDVDFILQYDPPNDTNEYIHRVGRTARGEGKSGQALLVLRPEESEFVKHLLNAKVPLAECPIPWDVIKDRQALIEDLVQSVSELKVAGREAFTSYIRAYALRTLWDAFDIHTLDIRGVGQSFGWREPPLVDIDINVKRKRKRNKNMATC